MTEEEVFLAAVDLPNRADRTAYLDEACRQNSELRLQVEELLAAHERSGQFLDEPAAEQMAAGLQPPRDQTLAFNAEGDDAMADNQKTNPASSDDDADDLQFLSPSTRSDALGRLGHYEMLQVLGKGGFGIVFRAFDDMLQRVVAVKVMAPQIATLSPARKRFLREARSSAAVRHENVVHVYEVGEQPLPYLVMEFIPGETLQQKLNRSGPLDVPEVLRMGRQVAEGLAAAHACDLIHRDIKPGNILLEGGSQKAKITDFGLARAADDASISQSGIIAGTPMFMAPEQALGHKIDQRADLFSLGSVLYQMASGRPPFRAPSALAVLKRVAEEPPRPISEIIPETPAWLCGIIAKLHAKNPADRFQSAREVADLLADCEAKLKAKQDVKNVLPAAKPAAPAASGRRKWVAVAAVLLLGAIALAVTEFAWVTHLFRRQQATTDPIKAGSDPVPHQVTKQEVSDTDGWVQLFNGKDLTGWASEQRGSRNWKVADGAITCSGPSDYLYTKRDDFGDFHLRAEVMINDGGNSGIYFRADKPVMVIGDYEAQITNIRSQEWKTGALYGLSPKNAAAVGPNVWFTYEIIAVGNRIRLLVNGTETASYEENRPDHRSKGHIALQHLDVTARARFRKIEIKELPAVAETKQEPLPPTFKNSIGMEFVIVPKGKSWLGGGKDKLGDKEVEIPGDFYLGKYEVTQEEWTQVMGENLSFFSRMWGGRDAVKDISDTDLKRFPVEEVSWDQCQLFVAKLNKLVKETRWVYRLPTETEWEYACRGGPMADKLNNAFDFYFAKPTNTLLPERANFKHDKGLNRTSKVGSYEPNILGLYDMHGNVWEWCDTWKARNGASPRVQRGGCWNDDAGTGRCRASSRVQDEEPTSHRHFALGLRLARVPSGAAAPEAK